MPIIQYPQDIVGIQELIWKTKPDLIIEIGVARGGSVIFTASMLLLLELLEKINQKSNLEIDSIKRKVIGIDIDIRKHNKDNITNHPAYEIIDLIEGSSVDEKVIEKVKFIAKDYKNIMLILDSNHEHDHVLKELQQYSQLVTKGNYCIVLDTIIEDLPNDFFNDRNWSVGNNPKTAVVEFLKDNKNFEIDEAMNNKLLISVAPDGYLKKIKK